MEQLGDQTGQSRLTLIIWPQVFLTRGDLDRALQLYQESLQLLEQLGDKQGKAASLSNMAQVFLTRGDLDRALQLYQESLQLLEQLGDKQGKAASLHQMAQVFLTRGDLDRALQLYQESLQLLEQLGDKQGKAASLSNMAQVYLTRGDLDRALQLYQESLQLKEQLGDKQGKAASLHQMAQVFLTRGDLDRALQLYQESLQLKEQLGDKKGKAASLSNMAQVFLTRGDLDRALQLYQESLQLKEQLGDKQGKAASLGQLSNLYMTKGDFDNAEKALLESLELKRQIGHLDGMAFSYAKLGQVAQAHGDKETALTRYREGVAIFERMGMPEANQVKQMIADLESGASTPKANDPLAQAIGHARSAAERGDISGAIQFQEQAVEILRETNNQQTLFAQLVNLAQFYAMAERFDDSLSLLDELLKMGDAMRHPELNTVQQMRSAIQKLACMNPEERAAALTPSPSPEEHGRGEQDDFETQLQAQLAQLPLEQRTEAEVQIRKVWEEFQRMTPEQQAALMDQGRRAQIENTANQARDAALAYFRKQVPKKDALDFLNNIARQVSENEEPGSSLLEVAALCASLAALIQGEPVPSVPVRYAAHLSAVHQEASKPHD